MASRFASGLKVPVVISKPLSLRPIEFYSALGAALLAVKGQAASETGRAYALALGLWEQLVISPASCGVLFSAT